MKVIECEDGSVIVIAPGDVFTMHGIEAVRFDGIEDEQPNGLLGTCKDEAEAKSVVKRIGLWIAGELKSEFIQKLRDNRPPGMSDIVFPLPTDPIANHITWEQLKGDE